MPSAQRCGPDYLNSYLFVLILTGEGVIVNLRLSLEELVDQTLPFFELIGMFAVSL